jgi:hypothetical protein
MAGEMLADARTGKNGRHALVGLLRQSVFGRLAGYEDVNDAERLRHDSAEPRSSPPLLAPIAAHHARGSPLRPRDTTVRTGDTGNTKVRHQPTTTKAGGDSRQRFIEMALTSMAALLRCDRP